jgi:hypothetical protein
MLERGEREERRVVAGRRSFGTEQAVNCLRDLRGLRGRLGGGERVEPEEAFEDALRRVGESAQSVAHVRLRAAQGAEPGEVSVEPLLDAELARQTERRGPLLNLAL